MNSGRSRFLKFTLSGLSGSPLLRYGLAVGAALAALLLRWALTPILGTDFSYLALFPAVMLVAITLGTVPALVTTIVGVALAEVWFVHPIGHFMPTVSLVVRFALLFLTSIYVGHVGEKLRAARATAEAEAKAAREKEEALRVSERKFSAIYDSAPYAIALSKLPDADIVDVNQAWLDLFGFAKEEVIGRTSVELGIMRDPEARARILEELRQHGYVRGAEVTVFTRLGGRLIISGNTDVIEFEDRKYLLATLEDITERKRAEEQLKKAKELGDALNRINAIIHSTLDFDAIMHRVIIEAATALNVDASLIGLFEDDYFVMKYVYNMPEEIVGCRIVSREVKGIHYAASMRDVVAFNDAFTDERLNVEIVRAYGIRSLMIAPFIARETVIGAMSFFCFVSSHYFSDMHSDFARKLSASLSLALEDARLFAELRAAQERASFFASAVENSTEPFTSVYPDGRLMIFNQAFVDLTGYRADELRSMTMMDLTPPEWLEHETEALEELHRTGKPQLFQKEYIRKDGRRVPIELKFHQAVDEEGNVLYYYAFLTDITERKRAEEEIRHLAHHDALTGLPNRRFLMDILTIELAKARRNHERFAVLFLDLDRFKCINDTLGHDSGDELLREVAERIRRSIRGSDTVARIGGDEFTIVLTDISHADDIIIIARKIVDSLREPYMIRGHGLYITTSIGISIYPDDAENIEGLFKNADIAMYYAKELGGNTYQFYDAAMNIRTVERIRLESWFRQSMHRGELEVYYHPQISADTRKVVCAEALVRWRHPEQGLLDPKHFIFLAEETGFITAIDEWVLRTACTQGKEWQEAGLPPICITANLSSRQFQRTDLVERIFLILKETGLEPKFLDIEITESTAMKSLEHTVSVMDRLVDIGIGISIDDFGTGYSSLSYLKKLPIRKLKIDQSFVRDIATDPDDRAIISAVTAMAQKMNLKVIAEGVETEEQLEFLLSIGCHEVQGYLFSHPLPAEEFKKLLMNGKKR